MKEEIQQSAYALLKGIITWLYHRLRAWFPDTSFVVGNVSRSIHYHGFLMRVLPAFAGVPQLSSRYVYAETDQNLAWSALYFSMLRSTIIEDASQISDMHAYKPLYRPFWKIHGEFVFPIEGSLRGTYEGYGLMTVDRQPDGGDGILRVYLLPAIELTAKSSDPKKPLQTAENAVLVGEYEIPYHDFDRFDDE